MTKILSGHDGWHVKPLAISFYRVYHLEINIIKAAPWADKAAPLKVIHQRLNPQVKLVYSGRPGHC